MIKKKVINTKPSPQELKHRWDLKRKSIYNLNQNIDRLKRKLKIDLSSSNEKDKLTALIIRIMIFTSERVGNSESSSVGHFGVTQFKGKHIVINENKVTLNYIGKSGVYHQKSFIDNISSKILKELINRKNIFVFTTKEGFLIKPDRINRYLSRFNCKSKDIRGFNANRMVVMELHKIGKAEEKQRPKIFNNILRKIASKVGHTSTTLRNHYLLPEIEECFYRQGVCKIKID